MRKAVTYVTPLKWYAVASCFDVRLLWPGRSWIVRPLRLHSHQAIVLAEGVEILAKRGEFRSPFTALLTASGTENVSITGAGAGAQIRMWREDCKMVMLSRLLALSVSLTYLHHHTRI